MQDARQPYQGICLDDGSGKNVIFLNPDGSKQRTTPPRYTPVTLEDGRRAYYYRGSCVRCGKRFAPICLSRDNQTKLYSANFCHKCLLESANVTTLNRRGDEIWNKCNEELPMTMMHDALKHALDPKRHEYLVKRARESQFGILKAMKNRRNIYRRHHMWVVQHTYGILSGGNISWGFDNNAFDEYCGGLDANHEPHGLGIKFYSDGTTYLGNWHKGERHCNDGGKWTRPDGAEYEGSWVHDQKHGNGVQRYPNGVTYKGEFAKGLEHGIGEVTYTNGVVFIGKFRFGKRDGMGTIKYPGGKTEKGIFRDPDQYYKDRDPPVVVEEIAEDPSLFQPLSLMDIAIAGLAKAIVNRRTLFPATKITSRLYPHLREVVTAEILEKMQPAGTKDFKEAAKAFAFLGNDEIVMSGTKLGVSDVDMLLYFEGGKDLKLLRCVSNRLQPVSVNLIGHQLNTISWSGLLSLDLSYNTLEHNSLQALMAAMATQPSVLTLKLSGCGIKSGSSHLVGKMISGNQVLRTFDLSFNVIKSQGIEPIAKALARNSSLQSLNLRSNGIDITGGKMIVDALKDNRVLEELCVADNKIGPETVAQIMARLSGTAHTLLKSLRVTEMEMPSFYKQGRFTREDN